MRGLFFYHTLSPCVKEKGDAFTCLFLKISYNNKVTKKDRSVSRRSVGFNHGTWIYSGKTEIKFLLLFILARAEVPLELDLLGDVAMCDSGGELF